MMADTVEPRTEAARWLLDHQGLVNISKPAHRSMRGDEIDLSAALVTVEREAVNAERARGLDADRLESAIHNVTCSSIEGMHGACGDARAVAAEYARLALLEQTP